MALWHPYNGNKQTRSQSRYIQKSAFWTEQLNDVEGMFGSWHVLNDGGTNTELVRWITCKHIT